MLYTDFDGESVDDVEDVILEALDDPRYQQRVPPLRALLEDPSSSPYDRFLACCALTTWGEPAGYTAVIEAAAQGSDTPWYGELIDRRYSVDETFSQLANAIRISKDFVREKNTNSLRLAALRALIGLADTFYFDWQLAAAIDSSSAHDLRDDIAATIRRGITALSGSTRPNFNLGIQLAELTVSLLPAGETAAVEFGWQLTTIDRSRSILTRLGALVSSGTTPASKAFGEQLISISDQETKAELIQALESRGA